MSLDLDDVRAAGALLAGIAHRTPVLTSRTLNAVTGRQVFLKCENMQRSGSFKFRGAYTALSRLSPSCRRAGVVAFSSGNHAQAVALAGRLLGVPTTIFMPTDAPAAKVAATRSYGAAIRWYDRETEDRAALAAEFAAAMGATLLPPFDHPDIIAGQGTAALELLEEIPDLDTMLVPVGGGGLIAGSLLVTAGRGVAVFGVEPAAADDTTQSLRAGRRVAISPPQTIADGLRATMPGELTFPILQRCVAGILTVSEEAIAAAVRFLLLRLKLLVEPSGAVGVAALLSGTLRGGRRVGVILSGGNVDPGALAALLVGESGGA
ncbi:MAG: pyridoxal-phosphate dependent enzyme [Chloroflexota bacterium]|nr:pyridoxal-phosphate dependent enzyme [Dehalococcoidia bacterium]MDW8254441.1 pyridoxal-phosphate dependent enzyme [Chloroflexota bacterium]